MRTGQLRHRVHIERPVEIQDESGGVEKKWLHVVTRWASVESTTGREMLESQQVQSESTHIIRMRTMSALVPTMRIRYGHRIFDINHVDDTNERKREMVVYCTQSPVQDRGEDC